VNRSVRISTSKESGEITTQQSPEQSEPINVTYCDLLRNANSYDGRLIRIKAIYYAHFEMSSLRDPNCPVAHGTWVDFGKEFRSCTKPEVLKTFEEAMVAKQSERLESDLDKAEVVFVGQFEVTRFLEIKHGIPVNGFGHMGMYQFRLNVNCIEEARVIRPR
jgi:hypothetical protein